MEAGNPAHELLLNPQKKLCPPERAEREEEAWSRAPALEPGRGSQRRERFVQKERRLSTVTGGESEIGRRTKVGVASAAPGT